MSWKGSGTVSIRYPEKESETINLNAVLAEWKPPVYDNTKGITLVTATTRRNSPNVRSWHLSLSPSFLLIGYFKSAIQLRSLKLKGTSFLFICINSIKKRISDVKRKENSRSSWWLVRSCSRLLTDFIICFSFFFFFCRIWIQRSTITTSLTTYLQRYCSIHKSTNWRWQFSLYDT